MRRNCRAYAHALGWGVGSPWGLKRIVGGMADWSPFRDAKTGAEWRELLLKQRGRCGLCGHRFPLESQGFDPSVYIALVATFDHIVARSNGGADDLENLRIVHAVCNKIRGNGDRLKHLPSIPRALGLSPEN